jgi:hypothetical protein
MLFVRMYSNGQRTHEVPAGGQQQPFRPFVRRHEFGGQTKLTTTLVHAVSDVTGANVSDVEATLNELLDPDALNLLFGPSADTGSRSNAQLTVTIWGYRITISTTGQITIHPAQGAHGARR